MSKHARPYRGVFPVVPTIFDERGGLDLEGQKRCIDFMIDAGSHGLCILANFSEQFVLSDAERDVLTKLCLVHVAGRVPVIVTTTHFSSHDRASRTRPWLPQILAKDHRFRYRHNVLCGRPDIRHVHSRCRGITAKS